jgi:hypothetical protein
MLIGILQTGPAPEALRPGHGDYPEMFARLLDGHGLTFRTWHVEAMEFPADVHAAEASIAGGDARDLEATGACQSPSALLPTIC